MTVTLRRARSRVPPAPPAALRAPLFADLVAGLDETERHVILDLGAASTSMLALLGRARSRVEIADLAYFDGVEQLNGAEPGPELADAAEAVLPAPRAGQAIDLVFCWDLPNYLTLPALAALMDAIGRRACRGAIAHALVFYSEQDMPERPGCFVPTPDGDLTDHRPPGTVVKAPRYSPEDLTNYMGGFEIDRARLLSNGMQEFLFGLGA